MPISLPKDLPSDMYFTVEDIAQIRNITVQGVRRAISDGRLKATKIAYTWFVSREELIAKKWIAE